MRRRTAANTTHRLRPRRSAPALERLESRYLYTAALTNEVLVNPDPAGVQTTALEAQKAVAVAATGQAVVVWSGSGVGDSTGIFGRRYDASGNPLGGEFLINSTTLGVQTSAAVASDAAGNFVVVWTSQGTDGSGYGVYAQRYSAAGVAQGGEFQINATTNGNQFQPSVAMDQDGDFVVSWTSPGQDGGSGLSVVARRYNASGVAQGGEFVANTQNVNFDQQYSRVAMDAAGDFVVVWQSYIQTTASLGVYGRRYDAAGNAQSPFEFLVNTAIAGDQGSPSIDMNDSGAFVVAWNSMGQDGSSPASTGVYAQRFTAAGVATGGEFRVSVTTAGAQQYPSVAIDNSGAFVVAWQSAGQDGAGWGLYAREYTAAGVARGGEARLNATTAGDQSIVSLAMTRGTGDYVAVWRGSGTGDAAGVFTRRFRPTDPGVTVTPVSGLATTEAGGTASFTVVLNAAPTADVLIDVSSSDPTEGTASATQLTFTAANWDTPQIVVVTGVNDAFVDGDVAYSIVTAAATSTDPNYSGKSVADVSVTNADDDTASIVVNPTSGLVTTEAGGTATFTVVLTAAPTASVTVGLSSSDTTEGTVSAGLLTFTSANWNLPQTVTVTGVNDATHDGNVAYTILTAAASSADPAFNGMNASNVAVTNTDNDPGGVTVSPTSGLVTTEAGGAATFTIVLTVAPFADVTIGLSSSNSAEGTLSVSGVTFTPANWNVPQTVTITGVDDAAGDGPVAYTIVTSATSSADAGYNGLTVADVSVTSQDDDGGLRATYYNNADFTGSSVTRIDAGVDFDWGAGSPDPSLGANTFSARWVGEVRPQFGQTYTFYTTSDDGVRLWVNDVLIVDNWTNHTATVNTGTITLAAGQWYAIRMEYYDNTGAAAAKLEWSSASQARQVVPQTRLRPSNVVPTAADDAYEVGQGGVLTVPAPTGVMANDVDGDGDTLTAAIVSGPARGSLSFNADGSFTYTPDPKFFGTDTFTYRAGDPLADSNVATVTITVARTAGISVTPTSGLVTSEAGGTATFAAVLDGQPTGPVTVQLLSSDASEGVLSQSILTFDASNWNVPQTVTVTGVDDGVVDGDAAYSISGTVSSADARYQGLSVPSVGVINQALPAPTGTAPQAADDKYHVFADGRLSVAERAGVLANDADADGDVLTAVLVQAPAHGAVVLRQDGSFVYVPERGFAGTDAFRYAASDGTAFSSPTEVTVVVDAVPTPPPAPVPGPGPQPSPPPSEDPAPPEPKQEPDPQPDDKQTPTEPEVEKPTRPGVVPPEPKKEVPPPPDKPPGPPPPANGGDQGPPPGPDQGGPDGGIELGPPRPPIMLEIPGAGVPAINTRAASASLVIGLESMARQMGSRNAEPVSVRAVRHAFVTITVGYVVWSLRGASLLASLLTSMPLWRSLDPLPILENRSKAGLKKKRRRWFSRRGSGGSAGGEQALGEMVS